MTIAVYPAAFDPITNGHIDIASRAAEIFERVVVGVYDRPSKTLLFSTDERVEMAQKALAHLPNVTVERYDDLTVLFARTSGAKVIVRGLRVLSDFEWELQLALTNRKLAPDVDTVCLMASQEYSFLSSSLVKEIGLLGGDIEELAPSHVVTALRAKFATLGEDGGGRVRVVSVRD
jgi:pantetheine-phosphate adenylyltransferase